MISRDVVFKFDAKTNEAVANISALQTSLKNVEREMSKMKTSLTGIKNSMDSTYTRISKSSRGVRESAEHASKAIKALGLDATNTLAKVSAQTARITSQVHGTSRGLVDAKARQELGTPIVGEFSAFSNFNPELDRINDNLGKLSNNSRKVSEGLDKASKSSKTLGDTLGEEVEGINRNVNGLIPKIDRMAAGFVAWQIGSFLRRGVSAVIGASTEFESTFANIRKTVNGTEEQFSRLETQMRSLAKEIPISVNELNEMAGFSGQLGVDIQNIEGVTKAIGQLTATTNLAGEEAALGMSRFLTASGLEQTEGTFNRMGSVLVELGNNFAAMESEILDISTRMAASGKVIGLAGDQIMAIGTAVIASGINVEAGGTAMQKTFIDLETAVSIGGSELQKFAEISGMSAQAFAETWQADAMTGLVDFLSGLQEAGRKGQNVTQMLSDVGITEARQVRTLLSTNAEMIVEAEKMARTALIQGTALYEEYQKRAETFASSMQMTKNRLNDVGITIGENLTPAIEMMVSGLEVGVSTFELLPDPIQAATAAVIAFTAALVALQLASRSVFGKSLPALMGGFKNTAMAASVGPYLGPIAVAATGPLATYTTFRNIGNQRENDANAAINRIITSEEFMTMNASERAQRLNSMGQAASDYEISSSNNFQVQNKNAWVNAVQDVADTIGRNGLLNTEAVLKINPELDQDAVRIAAQEAGTDIGDIWTQEQILKIAQAATETQQFADAQVEAALASERATAALAEWGVVVEDGDDAAGMFAEKIMSLENALNSLIDPAAAYQSMIDKIESDHKASIDSQIEGLNDLADAERETADARIEEAERARDARLDALDAELDAIDDQIRDIRDQTRGRDDLDEDEVTADIRALEDRRDSIRDQQQNIRDAYKETTETIREELDKQIEAHRNHQEELRDEEPPAPKITDYIAELNNQVQAQMRLRDNLIKIAEMYGVQQIAGQRISGATVAMAMSEQLSAEEINFIANNARPDQLISEIAPAFLSHGDIIGEDFTDVLTAAAIKGMETDFTPQMQEELYQALDADEERVRTAIDNLMGTAQKFLDERPLLVTIGSSVEGFSEQDFENIYRMGLESFLEQNLPSGLDEFQFEDDFHRASHGAVYGPVEATEISGPTDVVERGMNARRRDTSGSPDAILRRLGGMRAVGGDVGRGGMYEINEKGPEVLSIGSRHYLLMGADSGRITPNGSASARGGIDYDRLADAVASRGGVNIHVNGAGLNAEQVATVVQRKISFGQSHKKDGR